MSLSKTLTAAVAAVTIAGAVGLASAQSTPDTTQAPAPTAADTSQPATNTTPAPADTSSLPSSTTTTTTTDNASVGMELPAKADRN